MSDSKYNFQYCQKLVVFSKDAKQILLAKRHGEADYDGTFSFIGGKMETSDESIIKGLQREKNEEVGPSVRLNVYPLATHNVLFKKKDGSSMILPHYLAFYADGEIKLNKAEYSQYQWVLVEDISAFEPKVENITEMVNWALALSKTIQQKDLVEI